MKQGKYRIAVYAIAKDESAFARRWMESMSEADAVYVLDTGSSDGTPDLLRDLGAHVTVKAYPSFRFDAARNDSMDLVPPGYDILVCTDLDEVMLPGWRDALESAWREGATTAEYEYIWSFGADGRPDQRFTYEKVHAPGACRWTHPVHEVLEYSVPRVPVRADMVLEHRPDPEKSRAQYLGLLERSVEESPDDDRNMHYLGREYMFRGRWEDAVRTLERHLAMPTARWRAERAQSMRFIARCRAHLGDRDAAELWYRRACDEEPSFREPAVEYAMFLYRAQAPFTMLRAACLRALSAAVPDGSYLIEASAWGSLPYDLLSIAAWGLGMADEARGAVAKALELSPDDARIRANAVLMGVAPPGPSVV